MRTWRVDRKLFLSARPSPILSKWPKHLSGMLPESPGATSLGRRRAEGTRNWQSVHHLSYGSNPVPSSEHPNPTTKIGSKWVVHLPQNGIPLVLTHSPMICFHSGPELVDGKKSLEVLTSEVVPSSLLPNAVDVALLRPTCENPKSGNTTFRTANTKSILL